MASITIIPKIPPAVPPEGDFAPLDPATARELYGKVRDKGMGGPKPSTARLALYMVAGLSGWGSAAKIGNVTDTGETVSTAFSGRNKVSRGTPITVEKVWGWVEATHTALRVLQAGETVVISAAGGAAAAEVGIVRAVSSEIAGFKVFPDANEFRFLAWHALRDAPAWNGDIDAATVARLNELFSEVPVPFNEPSGAGGGREPRVLGGGGGLTLSKGQKSPIDAFSGPGADIVNRTADERAAAERERQRQAEEADPWAYTRKVGRWVGYGLGVVGVVVGGPRAIRWAVRMLY